MALKTKLISNALSNSKVTPSGSSVSKGLGEWIGDVNREALLAMFSRGRKDEAMASAPTVTVGANGAASTVNGNAAGTLTLGPDDASLTYVGTIPAVAGTSVSARYRIGAHIDYGLALLQNNGTSIQFGTDAPTLEFDTRKPVTNSGYYLVWVDDGSGFKPTTLTQTEVGSAGSSGGQYLVKIAFGSRAPRKIRIDLKDLMFGGLNVDAQSIVWAEPVSGLKWLGFGDSITAGEGANIPFGGYFPKAMRRIGAANYCVSAVGGTGYVNTGGGSKKKFIDRVADLTRVFTPDFVVVSGGRNDTAATATDFGTAVQAFANAAGAQCGDKTRFFFLTPFVSANLPASTYDTALINAVAASTIAARSSIINIRGWQTGMGTVAAPSGSGNGDFYMGADLVHPSPDGHEYLSQRVAAEIKRGLV